MAINQLTLSQKIDFLNKISFELAESKIKIKHSSLTSSNEHTISYFRINPNPIHLKNFAWGWILAGLFAIVATYPAVNDIIIGNMPENGASGLYVFIILIGVMAPALFFTMAYRKTHDSLFFLDAQSSLSLFSISLKRPNQEDVRYFLDELGKKISLAIYPEELSLTQKLEIYKKHLDFLLNEGVLTESEFLNIISRITPAKADVLNIVK